jgi:Undecaprenyl-phosphate glucose phosphotransferase
MIRRHTQFLESLKAATDLTLVVATWIASYFLRFRVAAVIDLFPITKHVPSFGKHLTLALLVAMTWGVVFAAVNLYRATSTPSLFKEVYRVLRAHATALLVFMAAALAVAEVKPSRAVLLIFGGLAAVLLVAARVVFREIVIARNRRPGHARRALVIGTGVLARELARKIGRHRELGLTVIGFAADKSGVVSEEVDGLPVLGEAGEVARIVREGNVDEVFVALPLDASSLLLTVLRNLSEEIVDVKVVPDLYQFISLRGGIEEFDGLPIVHLKETPLYGWRRVAKRGFDVAFSLAALVFGAPIYLAVAVAVKFSSRGPVFYKQERMGLDGRTFPVWKFRSMRVDAEQATGAVWASKDDPRRTRVGAFLRRSSLDELPQFWNVLKGDMSVVGPRPERPVFIEQFRERIPRYMLRHKVKAGLTGWAQVHGWRGNTDLEKRIEHDLYYIQNWSIGLDLRIIWMTAWRGLVNANAY